MNDDITAVKIDLERYSALAAVANMEGGHVLLDALGVHVRGCIEQLTGGYKKLPHVELMALCADLEAHLLIAKSLMTAPENYANGTEYLKNLLKDAEA